MKKILLWIAKIFKIDLTVTKEVIVVEQLPTIKYVSLTENIEGNVIVVGDLTIKGNLDVTGEITCFKINNK